jgi:hypothetical protein
MAPVGAELPNAYFGANLILQIAAGFAGGKILRSRELQSHHYQNYQ